MEIWWEQIKESFKKKERKECGGRGTAKEEIEPPSNFTQHFTKLIEQTYIFILLSLFL